MLQIESKRTFALSREERRVVLDTCNAAFGQPFDILFDLLPPDGAHFLGHVDGRLVAHLVVTDRSMRFGEGRWLRAGYIDAVATLPDFRRRGYASELLRAAIEIGRRRYDLFALATSIPQLYSGCGFAKWRGRQFVENQDCAGVVATEEQGNLMVLPFGNAVPEDDTLPVVANWRPGGGY
jgi:aminoglycoside 2'-N-acetyltransferase I